MWTGCSFRKVLNTKCAALKKFEAFHNIIIETEMRHAARSENG